MTEIDDPLFSAIEEELTLNVTVGALSASVMAIATDCVPLSLAPPPETPEISIVALSALAAS